MASGDGEGRAAAWCLFCKVGGELMLCDFPKCERVYHLNCLKPIPTSLENWQCPSHSCSGCKQSPAVVLCYSCPRASCSECLNALGFAHMHDGYGFCPMCLELAMYLETLTKKKPKMDPEEYGLFQHCKEYYWIVKKKYGFTLEDLAAVKKGREKQRGRKKRTLDKSDEDKSFQKKNLNAAGTSQNKVLIRDTRSIRVPSPTPNNVQRIYLTRNVVQKLLMEPDSFEEKVRKTFVGIELPKKPNSNRITLELVQVTGITKTSSQNGQICIKLQAKNRQDDISVDMVSDMDFQMYLCEDLRQKVKDGLIEMPDVEEFKRMARVLSEVLVDDFIIRGTRLYQRKMNHAHEIGWKEEYSFLEEKKKYLHTSEKKLQLISHFQQVDVEEITMPCENDMIHSENIMDKKLKGNPPQLLPGILEFKRGCTGKQHGTKLADRLRKVKQVQEKTPANAADDMVALADHSSVQISGLEKEYEMLLLSRDALVEQKQVDVMIEEFENNSHEVMQQVEMDKQEDELLRIERYSAAARLASLEQKVDRILQHMDTTTYEASKQLVPK